MGVLEGIEESTHKKNTQMDLDPTKKKYTKSHKNLDSC